MDKIIDDLLGAQKIIICQHRQHSARWQLNVCWTTRENVTHRAAMCLCHMFPACCAWVGTRSHYWKKVQCFQNPWSMRNAMCFISVKNLSKKSHQKEAERSNKKYPPETQNLPYKFSKQTPHLRDLPIFILRKMVAASEMGAEVCLGFQAGVLNANES